MIKITRTIIYVFIIVAASLTVYRGIRENVEFTKTVIEIIAILLTAIIALFVYVNFSPKISLRIIPTWIDKKGGVLKIRTEVENTSKVICMKKRIRFQILEQKLEGNMINEFVAFDKEYVHLMNPKPVNFAQAEEINLSTLYLYPGEVIAAERVYKINPELVQHAGLQFEADFGIMKYLLRFVKEHVERWTTVVIIPNER